MLELEALTVSPEHSIHAVMEAIDRGGKGIALVVDGERTLLGTVTDGNIRRALLSGATLDSPVQPFMQRTFKAVDARAGRSEVLDLMQARLLHQVPIVDERGTLVGLHLLHEIIGAVERPNWAVVMAGGRGERLRPLTDAIPKPMIKVAGRPILERIVLHLVGSGFRHVFIAVNYLSRQIEEHFGDGAAYGCQITYLREEVALGTVGALSLLPGEPAHPLVLLNGDLLTQCDLGAMLAFHRSGGYMATVGVHEYLHRIPFGVVEFEGARVTTLREKPAATWMVNAGIYVLEPTLVERIPSDTHMHMPALIEDCLDGPEPVGVFPIDEEWTDVGRHQELMRARGEEPT